MLLPMDMQLCRMNNLPQCEFSERETDSPRHYVLISNKKGTMWAATLPPPTQHSRTQELVQYTLHSQLPPRPQKGYWWEGILTWLCVTKASVYQKPAAVTHFQTNMILGTVWAQLLSQHCLLIQHKEEKGVAIVCPTAQARKCEEEKPRLRSLLIYLAFALVSPVLWQAVISAVGSCLHSWGSEVPAPADCHALENRTGVCFFIRDKLPEAREFTSDSELPQSLRTCRSSLQPLSQIHIQCTLYPVPASRVFWEIS